MIEHTVTFSLKERLSRETISHFFAEVQKLSTIPGVREMQIHRQISEKNPHQYRISMKFSSQEDYDCYNGHKIHKDFVEKYWLTKVADFQEADFVLLQDEASTEQG